LVVGGSLAVGGAEFFAAVVVGGVAFVVTGGSGSGKTTVLSTLLSRVEKTHRLVLVEDAAELRPDHPHVVRLEARPANAEGAGQVDLAVLVRQALRMRPDRLVVGEVRGAEVRELLTALNTGHEGGCCTLHANRAEHVPARFEALGAIAGLSREATHSQLAAAVEAVVHLCRDATGRRRVAGVALLVNGDDRLVEAMPAVRFERTQVVPGPAEPALRRRLQS
jgi:pilus assembly protein CpaF